MVIPAPAQSDVSSLACSTLVHLKEDVRAAIPAATGLNKTHLQDVFTRMDETLLPVQQVT